MRLTNLIIISTLLVMLESTVTSQDKISVDSEHFAGVMEAHLATLESWQTGDVLVRIRSSGEGRYLILEDQGPDKPIKYVEGPDASTVVVRYDMLIRFVFDLDTDRALIIMRGEYGTQVIDALDDDAGRPSQIVYDDVTLFDKSQNITSFKSSNGPIRKLDEITNISQILAKVPDLRGLGALERAGSPWNTEELKDNFEYRARPEFISSILHVGNERYQLVHVGTDRTEGQKVVWDWDMKRQLPLKFWLGNAKTGVTFLENTAEWKLVNDGHVPASSRFFQTNLQVVGARHYMVMNEGTMELHWFSFNQPLPDDLFEESILSDRKKQDELMSKDVFEKDGVETSNK